MDELPDEVICKLIGCIPCPVSRIALARTNKQLRRCVDDPAAWKHFHRLAIYLSPGKRDAVFLNGRKRSVWRCTEAVYAILKRAAHLRELWFGYSCSREELVHSKECIGAILRCAVQTKHLSQLESLTICQKRTFDSATCVLANALGENLRKLTLKLGKINRRYLDEVWSSISSCRSLQTLTFDWHQDRAGASDQLWDDFALDRDKMQGALRGLPISRLRVSGVPTENWRSFAAALETLDAKTLSVDISGFAAVKSTGSAEGSLLDHLSPEKAATIVELHTLQPDSSITYLLLAAAYFDNDGYPNLRRLFLHNPFTSTVTLIQALPAEANEPPGVRLRHTYLDATSEQLKDNDVDIYGGFDLTT